MNSDLELDRLLSELEPVASSMPGASTPTVETPLTDGALTSVMAPASAGPRKIGTPRRPGSTTVPLSLASMNDDFLPAVTRSRFLRRR